jgi:LmbE family N-acetylglucosaminyl deacetylase
MKILFLSPHADDSEVGAGGSLIRFIEEGHTVFVMVFSYHSSHLDLRMDVILKKEFVAVMKNIGLKTTDYKISEYKIRYLQDNRQAILEDLILLRDDFNPDLVVCPSLHDFHQDHQVIANESVRAFKKSCSIIGYEVPWNHVTFDTDLFIKLGKKHVEKKYRMLQGYPSQFTKRGVLFSKEYMFGLARVRGSQCNAEYAEAFESIRWIL